MKLRAVITNHAVETGKDYEIVEQWKGCYSIGEYSVSLEWFETVKDMFYRLCQTSEKFIVMPPGGKVIRENVDLLLTDNSIIVYVHTKGSHWNVGGNHHYYVHDINTGIFTGTCRPAQPILLKEKFLAADYKKFITLKTKH